MNQTQLERPGATPAAGVRRPDRETIGLLGVGLLGAARDNSAILRVLTRPPKSASEEP